MWEIPFLIFKPSSSFFYMVNLHWPHSFEIWRTAGGRVIILFNIFVFTVEIYPQSEYHTSRSPSLPINLYVFLRPLSSPLSVYPSGGVQQAPEPRGQSCSQGNSNSPQSWYQNSLKCGLSDSSQWVQSKPNTSRSPFQQNVNRDRRGGEQVNLLYSCHTVQSGLVCWVWLDQTFQKLFFCLLGMFLHK